MTDWLGDENDELAVDQRWPMAPTDLLPRERWLWWGQLWADVCALRNRYRLGVRSGWWEDQVQVEALAALAAWVERDDSGEWDDPPGKLSLLSDLERLAALLRDGGEPFHPDRGRLAFARFLIDGGCQPPPGASTPADDRAGALCPCASWKILALISTSIASPSPVHPRDAASAPGAFALLQDRCPSLIRRVSQALTAERAGLGLGPAEDLTRGRVGSQHRPVGHGEQDAVGTVLIQRHRGLGGDHPRGPIPFSWVPVEIMSTRHPEPRRNQGAVLDRPADHPYG
jgi:hypothetical protein